MIEIPEDSIRSMIDPWWVKDSNNNLCPGSLIFTHVPHFDQTPLTFEPLGRKSPTEHKTAEVRIEPLRIGSFAKRSDLPVAALSLNKNEYWRAFKSKLRPCLVLSDVGLNVDKELIRGRSNSNYQDCVIIAPYYGSKAKDGKRSGFPEPFVERVRHCEYPQYLWDFLPHDKGEESILRFDQMQPLGKHHQAYRHSEWKLSKQAFDAVFDHFMWRMTGGYDPETLLAMFKDEIKETFD